MIDRHITTMPFYRCPADGTPFNSPSGRGAKGACAIREG